MNRQFRWIGLGILILVGLVILTLRIIKVSREEATSVRLQGVGETDEFVSAVYAPTRNKITVNDSIIFYPGKIFIQDEIVQKHRFLIFNRYYEKSKGNGKYATYESGEKENKHNFVIWPFRNDTIFDEFSISSTGSPDLNFYSLPDRLLNKNNVEYNVTDFEKADTLVYFLKSTMIGPFRLRLGEIRSKYHISKIKMNEQPIDSILYVDKKNNYA